MKEGMEESREELGACHSGSGEINGVTIVEVTREERMQELALGQRQLANGRK